MNVQTTHEVPGNTLERINFALDQSGHRWRVEQLVAAGATAMEISLQFEAWGDGLRQWPMYAILALIRDIQGSVVDDGAVSGRFVHPQQSGDPSFVQAAHAAVLREVYDGNVYDPVRAIVGRLAQRGILVSHEQAFKMWDEFRFD